MAPWLLAVRQVLSLLNWQGFEAPTQDGGGSYPCTPACGHWDLKMNKLNRLRESEVTLLRCWDRGSIYNLSFWLELSPGGCWGPAPCTEYKVLMVHQLPLAPPLFLACQNPQASSYSGTWQVAPQSQVREPNSA